MVRNYARKSNRGTSYKKETLEEALNEVQSGRMTAYKASNIYGIPLSTLNDHIKGTRGKRSNTYGRSTALSSENEKRLAGSLLQMEKYGFGLSRKEILQIVGQFTTQNKIKTPFKDGIPGEDWFLGFAKRNRLSIKKPQSVEIARKRSCNPFVINTYFTLLEKCIKELGLEDKPDRIWNLDETSFCTDPSKTKIVGGKNLPCTRTTSTPGRENISVMLACSAAGEKAAPLIIFKGKHMWSQWYAPQNTGFPGTTYAATGNGWMESDVFKNYFERSFLKFVENTRPVLLIYDGHATHVSIELVELAVQAGVTILKLPPHTSHILQPLDLSVFKPLKGKWDEALVKWQRQHVGYKLPKREFSRIIGELWQALDIEIIKNGFRKGGIYPFSANVIPETLYDTLSLKQWKETKKTPDVNLSISTQTEQVSLITSLIEEAAENPMILIEEVPFDGPSVSVVENIHPFKLDEQVATTTHHLEDIGDGFTNHGCESNKVAGINQNKSFEELLLSIISKNKPNLGDKQKKVASGAEVITAEEVIERIKQQKLEKEKQPKRKKIPQPKKQNNKKEKRNKKVLPAISIHSGEENMSSDSDSPLTIVAEVLKQRKSNENLCSICLCDYHFYMNKNDWIRCVNCMQWVCGVCNKGSKNLRYECPRCEDDQD